MTQYKSSINHYPKNDDSSYLVLSEQAPFGANEDYETTYVSVPYNKEECQQLGIPFEH